MNKVVIKCSMGQKKSGVECGGSYLLDKLQIIPDRVINYNNEYPIWDNILDSFQQLKTIGYNNIYFGGDHSISISTISNTLYHLGSENVFVIWIDAHADINNMETSLTGNVHGMPVYYLIENFVKTNKLLPSNLVYIGIRDLDEPEWEFLKKYNIEYYDIRLVKQLGISEIVYRIDQKIKPDQKIHLSFDVDSLDPTLLDSTGTVSDDGLHPEQVVQIVDFFKKRTVAYDVTEFNPELGDSTKSFNTVQNILSNMLM
jgi:arginase